MVAFPVYLADHKAETRGVRLKVQAVGNPWGRSLSGNWSSNPALANNARSLLDLLHT